MATSRVVSSSSSQTTKGRKNERSEEIEKSRQIDLIHRQNKNIVQELKNMHPQERELFLKKRGYVDQLAANFKQLHELGEYDKPLHTISAAIYDLCNQNEVPISHRWIQKIVPAEYKRERHDIPKFDDDDDSLFCRSFVCEFVYLRWRKTTNNEAANHVISIVNATSKICSFYHVLVNPYYEGFPLESRTLLC